MLKRFVAVLFVGCALALVVPREVEAVPIQCPDPAERLALTPFEVSVDGTLLYPSSNGRYQTDGGLSFSVGSGQLVAVEGALDAGCSSSSNSLTVEVIDPFTGRSTTLTMERAP